MRTRALVVDDNPFNLKLACDLLVAEGFAVERAVDAPSALETLARMRFDVILMDIELPGMDGLSLTRILKSRPDTWSIPIIALTAYAMKGDDQKAFDAGCDGYITKPIDVRTFPARIMSYLTSSRPQSGE